MTMEIIDSKGGRGLMSAADGPLTCLSYYNTFF